LIVLLAIFLSFAQDGMRPRQSRTSWHFDPGRDGRRHRARTSLQRRPAAESARSPHPRARILPWASTGTRLIRSSLVIAAPPMRHRPSGLQDVRADALQVHTRRRLQVLDAICCC
jgi:hypothetical protein